MSDAITYMNELTRWPDAPPLTDQWLEALAKACDMIAARDEKIEILIDRLADWEDSQKATVRDSRSYSFIAQKISESYDAMRAEIARLRGQISRLEGCDHSPAVVTADILEGDVGALCVQWCQLCGAYRRGHETPMGEMVYGEWRDPQGVMSI